MNDGQESEDLDPEMEDHESYDVLTDPTNHDPNFDSNRQLLYFVVRCHRRH